MRFNGGDMPPFFFIGQLRRRALIGGTPMKHPAAKFDDDQIIEALLATRCNLAEATRFLIRKWDMPCHRDYVAKVVKKRRRLIEFVRDYRATA
jgi:hypothetical protein